MGTFNRREFVKTLVAGTAGLGLLPAPAMAAAGKQAFSFVILGDLHFDKLEHHDLEWLQRDKPDDVRQAREYSSLTTNIMPRLFATVRETISEVNRSPDGPVAFVLQVGDVVEGLCGSEKLAVRQNTEALGFVRAAGLGAPFLFAKGNHDITGPGATDAFKTVFHPFLREQMSGLAGGPRPDRARYAIEQGEAFFCFFDAYDKESLGWLEAALAHRTARHCFVVIHPPVVPYGARSTWHIFSSERERAHRERLLELLGRHTAFVLGGHIHKYNLLVRATPHHGKFLQLAVSSVIRSPEPKPQHLLSGVSSYNADQVKVEPAFSPATEQQRRDVYTAESPFIQHFEYADLPGYAVVTVAGPQVTARIYSGTTRQLWTTRKLSELLTA
jgi:hypothetical protein